MGSEQYFKKLRDRFVVLIPFALSLWKGAVWCVAVVIFLAASVALADIEAPPVDVSGTREPEKSVTTPASSVSTLTVVDATTLSAAQGSVAEVLENRAGVQIRSRGGVGAFTTVSLRGSDANEVAVYVDGVPLSRSASGVIDLSLIPADGLERIEVYRGVPPVEFGSEAIGGVINLVTKKIDVGRSFRLSLGGGSWGTRSVSGAFSQSYKSWAFSANASYRGSQGDFSYYDNGGTFFTLADDKRAIRQNNDFNQVQLDVRAEHRGTIRWFLQSKGFLKFQGVPGFGVNGLETRTARLTTSRLLLEGGAHGGRGKLQWDGRAFVQLERYQFLNVNSEKVGPFGASASEGEAISVGGLGRVDLTVGRRQLFSFLSDLKVEKRQGYDLLRPLKQGFPPVRLNFSAAISDEIRLANDKLAIVPAARVDLLYSTYVLDSRGETVPNAGKTDVFVSPRLGLRWSPKDWIILRGSAGRFVRFPTLIEQFGDGAFILAARSLNPEVAWGGDAGGVVKLNYRKFTSSLETIFFARQVENIIAFIASANALAATNIGTARFLGAELRWEAHLDRWLSTSIDYTFLDTNNFGSEPGSIGKQLPNRARHNLTAIAELRGGPFVLSYQADYVAGIFRDAQNYNRIPDRVLHGVGVRFERQIVSLRVDVKNVADLRVIDLPLGGSANVGRTAPYALVDFFDYPLPGRAIYFTLNIKT